MKRHQKFQTMCQLTITLTNSLINIEDQKIEDSKIKSNNQITFKFYQLYQLKLTKNLIRGRVPKFKSAKIWSLTILC